MKTVTIVDYDSEWPENFRAAAGELRAAFAGVPVLIEHVGSTSVPGLCAKPVIDILLGAQELLQVEERTAALTRLGYRYRPEYEVEIPDRRYFVRPGDGGPRIHLHAVAAGSPLWLSHLAFRDALRSDPQLAQQYSELKHRLAVAHADDRAAYTAAKAPFIERVLAGSE